MHLNSRPVASFDPEGLIFAAGIDSRQLKLYDLRSFDKVCTYVNQVESLPNAFLSVNIQGPFSTFHVRQDFANCEWTGLKFASDGKRILISTNISQIKLLDAFQGDEIHTLSVSHTRQDSAVG